MKWSREALNARKTCLGWFKFGKKYALISFVEDRAKPVLTWTGQTTVHPIKSCSYW